ncbi:Lipoate-protein ligase A [Sulfobacillus thermosulfidooxidans DSM 9293]|uniref:Lipoate-protein ligase A n=1 Tax=Sulfobacillus thermosulfidooxidans (strain DSM 9293 / VKM B-1269 / AT-1) TaxID=929705 RepID=A0A1W1W7W0_SULTA|nr:lipoate--protein ligase family protein [Sulfobacillus thermosulfidooxidans]SMC02282.1 Lipoate-protein ligase A [Sulfobacillus thermosulfidooxidans DSM 9293]
MTILPDARFITITAANNPETFHLSPVLAEVLGRWSARTESWGILIREHNPYLLLGPKDRRLPFLDEALNWAQNQGYPVYMRVGGGSAVLLDRTCISFAVSRPCRDLTVWEQNFRDMTAPIIDGLRMLGIATQFGRAEGSYCEGPYDLVTRDGKKIAGIAQAIRGGSALVSGMILVQQDPVRTTEFIQEFYHRAGSQQILRADVVTALSHHPGFSQVTIQDVHDALIAGFEQHYHLISEPFSPEEWQEARELNTLRCLRGDPISEPSGRTG